jgi:hypothetical protein
VPELNKRFCADILSHLCIAQCCVQWIKKQITETISHITWPYKLNLDNSGMLYRYLTHAADRDEDLAVKLGDRPTSSSSFSSRPPPRAYAHCRRLTDEAPRFRPVVAWHWSMHASPPTVFVTHIQRKKRVSSQFLMSG